MGVPSCLSEGGKGVKPLRNAVPSSTGVAGKSRCPQAWCNGYAHTLRRRNGAALLHRGMLGTALTHTAVAMPSLHAPVPQISDLLREMLLVEESDNAGLYGAEEQDELLWRIFEHVVLGGSCCQFEVGGAGRGPSEGHRCGSRRDNCRAHNVSRWRANS